MGWVRDLADPRDFTQATLSREELVGIPSAKAESLPAEIDLSAGLSPVFDQGSLNCSSVCSVLDLVDYFERSVHGREYNGSMLYLYKAARKLDRVSEGNVGVGIRTTFKALRRFGTPPADLWHENPIDFDRELNCAVAAGYARDFQDLTYIRIGDRQSEGALVRTIKCFLTAGLPIAFGFCVPSSLTHHQEIPFRPTLDGMIGGQAALAVGYDDKAPTTPRGAFRVRLSWGADWGDNGYGWLPYPFLEHGWATDFWTALHSDWMEHC